MKILIAALITLTCFSSFAKKKTNHYRNFSKHTSGKKVLNREDFMKRLSVTGSVYVTSADGTQLFHDVTEMRAWSLNGNENFTSTWISGSDEFGAVALKQKWFLNDKNQLIARIEQFEAIFNFDKNTPPKIGKSIVVKEFIITNFSPFTLDISFNGNKKTVVKFSPSLRPKEKENDQIDNFPIRGEKMVVFDSKGKIWAESVSFSGKFVSLKTRQGTIYMSLHPFKGAKKLGLAVNGKINLEIGKKHRLQMVSSLPFLPSGIKAAVYGVARLKEKADKMRSVFIRTGDTAEEFNL